VTLTFDLLTLKVVSESHAEMTYTVSSGTINSTIPYHTESHVTWATSVSILVFLGLSVVDLDPMYATDRQTTDVRQIDRRQTKASLNAPA